MTEENPEKEFRVADRRRMSETGEVRKEAVRPEEPVREASGRTEPDSKDGNPEMTFTGFVVGIGTQAMLSLGQFADPQTGRAAIDLSAARQLIDILGILEEKTKGNLEKQEEELLKHLLFDLRTQFVEAANKK